ncbi:MAG TPA: copper transporter [Actinomycetota bacterium]|nr:copper transporter [Actinomycetota bacterium]
MIDFRFHMISLVAVFLALGLGVLIGTAVLNEELVDRIKNNVQTLQEDKRALQEDVLDLDRQLDADARFADVAEQWLTQDTLTGRRVILLDFAGTDDRVEDNVRTSIETAGGEIAAEITFTEKFALPGVVERDQLALALGSTSDVPAELRSESGDVVGSRLASAALGQGREGRADAADAAARDLLDTLAEAGFVDLDRDSLGRFVPDRGLFVIAGGSVDRRPFNVPALGLPLAVAIADRGAPVVVAESSDSAWGLVAGIRTDAAEDRLTTVDDVESISGRIATVLGLVQSLDGMTDHYGTGPGAEEVIPRPTPEE